jgi:hypothetical protein
VGHRYEIIATIQIDDQEVWIYTKDHTPAHVHVGISLIEVIVLLAPSVTFRKGRDADNLTDFEQRVILEFVSEHLSKLQADWVRLTGLPLE